MVFLGGDFLKLASYQLLPKRSTLIGPRPRRQVYHHVERLIGRVWSEGMGRLCFEAGKMDRKTIKLIQAADFPLAASKRVITWPLKPRGTMGIR